MKITIVGSGINERRIATFHEPKPGRVDGPEPFPWDWEANLADHDPERDPTGYGSTEENAIADLITQLEERESP